MRKDNGERTRDAVDKIYNILMKHRLACQADDFGPVSAEIARVLGITCKEPNCPNDTRARGYCYHHYSKKYRRSVIVDGEGEFREKTEDELAEDLRKKEVMAVQRKRKE